MSPNTFPKDKPDQSYVTVHALSAGYLTLPEHLFVQPSTEGNRNTVPSLSFLIQHTSTKTQKHTRVVFDLGLRRDLSKYPSGLQAHLKTRQPLTTSPDVAESLRIGGLSPDDIDFVILSHVHWDHIGTPGDFAESAFVVGNGSLELLRSGADPSKMGSHSFYESDLLPPERTTELPQPVLSSATWQQLGPLPNAIDVFSDGSLYIVDSPGHLQGHINLLARIGPSKWVYLAGDACHDRRLLRKELEIGTWTNDHGDVCCIHFDRAATEKTIEIIAGLERLTNDQVEVILAHDVEWVKKEDNRERFWPGAL
ncbi:beta-lactamase-like protein [Tricladium varicosporioides]|nr:beta-lactamase-like protein [Hymenoscyphus varicosporioides]